MRPGGISFDELARTQAWVGDVMDELDPFPGAYMLEVSSPGIDRPLRTPEHFARFAGETVTVKTTGPIDGRSSFTGELLGFEDGLRHGGRRRRRHLPHSVRQHQKGPR